MYDRDTLVSIVGLQNNDSAIVSETDDQVSNLCMGKRFFSSRSCSYRSSTQSF